MGYTEYAVEINDKNDRFISQVDVFDTYEEAEEFVRNNDIILSDGEYLNIIFIGYDECGNETEFGSVV